MGGEPREGVPVGSEAWSCWPESDSGADNDALNGLQRVVTPGLHFDDPCTGGD